MSDHARPAFPDDKSYSHDARNLIVRIIVVGFLAALFWQAIIAAEAPSRPRIDLGRAAPLDFESWLGRSTLARCAGLTSSDNVQDRGMGLAVASPSACPRWAQHQQRDTRSNCAVDDEPSRPTEEMDTKARNQPSAEQGADDADCRIANQPKARSAHDAAGEIADADANQQNDDHMLV
jgi:hypothetical protein